jgi:pyridinium-3,5-biscarboxylic acid mononucleotide sulfurtransferase
MSPIENLTHLTHLFETMEQALIAYSGGIDSTLVAKVAYDVLGDRAIAITANSPSLLPEDLEDAKTQATKWTIPTTPATPSIAATSAKANSTTP